MNFLDLVDVHSVVLDWYTVFKWAKRCHAEAFKIWQFQYEWHCDNSEFSSQADRRQEIKRLISRVKRDQERERACKDNRLEEGAVKHFQLPKTFMLLDEFVKCVQESGIVKDQGTILRLFDALTVGKYHII